MNRFIFRSTIAAIIIVSLLITACRSTPKESSASITILQTNDVHSALDNAPRVTSEINRIRKDAGKDNLLLLDAGDVSTGTLYGTVFQGEAEAWFMNHDGYDAMNLGSHEFDRGPQGLTDFVKQLNFPVISSNLTFNQNSPLGAMIKPYIILEKSGARFGILGLINPDTREASSPGPDISFKDEIASAKSTLDTLKKLGLDKIIVLSNLGWEEDLKLASQVPGIDVIIGGHTHTIPADYPTVIKTGSIPTLVVQAGAQNQYLGQLNISFNADGIVQDWTGSRLIAINDKIEAEAAAAAKIAEYQKAIGVFTQNIIGKTGVDLDGDRARNRSQETNLGNLVADSLLDKAAREGVVLALISGGAIRASVPAGDISLGNVLQIMPYHNFLVTVDISGAQLMTALENGVSLVEAGDGRFPQIAGFRFVWDPQAPYGSRVRGVEIKTSDGFKALDTAAVYRMVTTNFIAAGGDGYSVFKDGRNLNTLGDVDSDVLAAYIKAHSPVNPAVEGRIKRAGQ